MGTWFRQEARPHLKLAEGERFRRSSNHAVVETAKVLAVVADQSGIPHVRFRLEIARSGEVEIEQRTLSADSFALLYHDQVSP